MFDLFTARSNLLPHAFVWALYIYMRKMLRIHDLDISSKEYDPIELIRSIGAPGRHKRAKTEAIENPRWQPDSPS